MESPDNARELAVIGPNGSIKLDGVVLPHLKASHSAFEGGSTLVLDNRFQITFSDAEEMQRVLWFIGHAMAVAAGYDRSGEGSKHLNPYAPTPKKK